MQTGLSCSTIEIRSSQNSEIAQWNRGPKVAVQIEWDSGRICAAKLALSDFFCCIGGDSYLLEWLELYSLGKPPFFLLQGNFSPFQQKAMQALCKIPFGETISYQQLAILCGTPRGARAIGNACGKNPFPLFVPCHRVIRTGGKIESAPLDFVKGLPSWLNPEERRLHKTTRSQNLAARGIGGFAFDLEIKRRLLEFEIKTLWASQP